MTSKRTLRATIETLRADLDARTRVSEKYRIALQNTEALLTDTREKLHAAEQNAAVAHARRKAQEAKNAELVDALQHSYLVQTALSDLGLIPTKYVDGQELHTTDIIEDAELVREAKRAQQGLSLLSEVNLRGVA